MGFLKKDPPWERAYRKVWQKEEAFLCRYESQKESAMEKKLGEMVPENLVETLHAAFVKAFGVVFEKGTGPILKAGKIEEKREAFQIRRYAANLREDGKNLRSFSKAAAKAGRGNVLLSGAAGIGMGAFGVMLPDVPLFTALLLKSVYETAESFGYRSEEEQLYVLRLLAAALSHGEELRCRSAGLDAYAQEGTWTDGPVLETEMETAARKLSEAVLYSKVLQNIPLVGAIGGAGDAVVLSRVQHYAAIKYEKRFLLERRLREE